MTVFTSCSILLVSWVPGEDNADSNISILSEAAQLALAPVVCPGDFATKTRKTKEAQGLRMVGGSRIQRVDEAEVVDPA